MHLLRKLSSSPTFEKEDSNKKLLSSILPSSLDDNAALHVLPCLETNDASVIAVSESDNQDSLFQSTRKPKRVRIDERCNQSYEFDRVTPDEYENVWYNCNDMEYFRRERRMIVTAIQKAELPTQQWSRALLQVYYAFRQLEHPQEVADSLATTTTSVDMDEFTVGLEQHILPALGKDYVIRRQHLLHQFHHLQYQCYFPNEQYREELLRDTSRLTSRATRLFAQYCAQVAAECAD